MLIGLESKASRYTHNVGAVFSLKVYILCCPKYRRKVLVVKWERGLKTCCSP